ncbi:hypothetical protein F7725_017761 [Dissostichus mawsoni]|uniref:Uncharacterized protein n=1 Tax=Dissostichus mawsoni TaxID=36200 RepID=A0A7J5XPM2_DISMA|nr:hypothetical protein F7725_017761 [Dissostichus mawsoni]
MKTLIDYRLQKPFPVSMTTRAPYQIKAVSQEHPGHHNPAQCPPVDSASAPWWPSRFSQW